MKRVSMALVAVCFVSSHLMAQSAGVRTFSFGRNLGVRQNTDGSVCFPPPSYDRCNYDFSSQSLDLYRLLTFSSFWNGKAESDAPQPVNIIQRPEPAPPPPTPAKPVLHEYKWPEQANMPASFSIVTNSGTVYLAVMVWVQEDGVHFNSPDGDVHELPLTSVSRSLTETANLQKKLNLPLP